MRDVGIFGRDAGAAAWSSCSWLDSSTEGRSCMCGMSAKETEGLALRSKFLAQRPFRLHSGSVTARHLRAEIVYEQSEVNMLLNSNR